MKKMYKIEGMHGDECALKAEKCLESCSGVTSAHVDFKSGMATVEGDNFSDQDLFNSLKEASFTGEVASQK